MIKYQYKLSNNYHDVEALSTPEINRTTSLRLVPFSETDGERDLQGLINLLVQTLFVESGRLNFNKP